MSCSEIQHGETSHSAPISVSSNGTFVNADALPTVTDIIGEDGNSLGAGPNFGLNAAPVVSQDLDVMGNPIPGLYRITFVGQAADAGVFQGGDHYRIVWSALVGGSTFSSEQCACVASPVVSLGGCGGC